MVQAPDAVSNQRHKLEAEGAMALIEIVYGEMAFASRCRPVAQRLDSLHLQKCLDTPPQLVEILELRLGEFAQVEFGIGHWPLRIAI